jgi:predicted S18 family serine protease
VYVETGPEHFAHALTYAEIALPFAPQAIGQDIAKFM